MPMAEIYHLALHKDWLAAIESAGIYYPPTFKQDGMTHAAPDTETLIEVANQFYRGVQGPWCFLAISIARLNRAGIDVRFEPAAAVGDREDHFAGSEALMFPHIYGGIPEQAVVYIGSVEQDRGGVFLSLPSRE